MMIDYVRGDDCEEVLCGEHGPLEHLLFLAFPPKSGRGWGSNILISDQLYLGMPNLEYQNNVSEKAEIEAEEEEKEERRKE